MGVGWPVGNGSEPSQEFRRQIKTPAVQGCVWGREMEVGKEEGGGGGREPPLGFWVANRSWYVGHLGS